MASRHHKLFYGSSYDRGLDTLLFMWPDIIKQFPDAELHICYGWNLFDKANGNNPERMQWKENVQMLMSQKGIHHHGRVGREELKKVRQECGIWAYPTWFPEINCITALECQDDGVVPVTMDNFALRETVGTGIKVEGSIEHPIIQQTYLKELLLLMGDEKRWKEESEKAKEFAKEYDWSNISKLWDDNFTEELSTPKVSVITLSIRRGWWNIMANNLSKQSYKHFEWVIVDDYKEDRSKIAEKYAKLYNLDIKYIRGDKCLGKYDRRYGLVRANNIGWKASSGELLVYLQDFIIIPERGLEWLVDLHRHNKNALLAPVDQYWFAKEPNRDNEEDWWDGELDIIDSFSWRNVRVQNVGIRRTDNPLDFEMNYCAIPKHIVEDLNGWWEFYDNALGFDNTEIAYRALKKGYYILLDDTNECKCINLWPIIKGEKENIEGRERNLSVPYWVWMLDQMEKGNLPVTRDEKLDESINMTFRVPEDVPDEEAHIWTEDNAKSIAEGWGDANKLSHPQE